MDKLLRLGLDERRLNNDVRYVCVMGALYKRFIDSAMISVKVTTNLLWQIATANLFLQIWLGRLVAFMGFRSHIFQFKTPGFFA